MSFSQRAATNVVPLLSRLVLAAAFIPAGFNKVWNEQTFTGKAAEILSDRGIGEPAEPADELSLAGGIVLASFQDDDVETGRLRSRTQPASEQDEQPQPAEEETTGEETLQEEVPAQEPEVQPQPTVAPETEATPVTAVNARGLYGITVMLVKGGWNWKPGLMAWLAALAELIGGALILIGLLSRIWGLGLAVVMGFAFYLTSWGALGEHGLFSLPIPAFNTMFSQMGLFVLAFGILLTGAGPLSLDRAIFRRTKTEIEDEVLVDLG